MTFGARALIRLGALKKNLAVIRDAAPDAKVMAVIKANAYGHGSIELSRTAVDSGCEYLGVAFVEEGIELRKKNIVNSLTIF